MINENQKISLLHTPCRDCYFATYNGSTQTGCSINMIDKYKERGYDILEVYDNSKEFFVVNDKRCLFLRDNNWVIKNNISSIPDAHSKCLQENTIQYIAIIKISDESKFDDTKLCIDGLLSQTIKPVGILVMTDNLVNYDFHNLVVYLNNLGIKWRMQKFTDKEMTDTQKMKAIIQSAPMNRFYFLVEPEKYMVSDIDFISNINTKVVDGLIFGCINIFGGLLFSYLSWQYAKNAKDIDIVLDTQYHIKYEDIK